MARIYFDRFASTTARAVYCVQADAHRRVACECGRIPGNQDTAAHATIEGPTNRLNAGECRDLADALTTAAGLLEGDQGGPDR